MSLLGTNWVITDSNGNIIDCEFQENNVVTFAYQNGQVMKHNWDELDGAFAIEAPNSTVNPNKWEVYSGTYFGNVGHGVYFSFGVSDSAEHFRFNRQNVK